MTPLLPPLWSRRLLVPAFLVTLLSAGSQQALAYTLESSTSNIYESQGNCDVISITARVESGDATPTTITLSKTGPGTLDGGTLSISISSGATHGTTQLTYCGFQDDVDNGTRVIRFSGSSSAGGSVSGVNITVHDDDAPPKVTLTLTPSTITENGDSSTVTATLSATSPQSTTVTVAATAVSPAVSGDFTLSSNKVLTIAANQTSSTGTVTITARNNDVDTAHKRVTVSATATNTDGVANPDNQTLIITDDDERGVTVSETAVTVTEASGAGRTDTYTVKLNSQPTGTVTVGVSSGDTSIATVNKSSLSFSRTTWSTAQTVTVTGVDDNVDSDRSTTITHTVSGADYASVTAASVSVTLTDDDTKGVTVSKMAVTVTEAAGDGRTETYTVKLDTRPTGTVTVGVASGNTSVATVNKSSLTFTTTTWSTPQTVTVTGVDDEVDSNRSTTITHTVSGADYAGVTAASVSVTLTDDDQKGVTVSKTAVTVTEAAGAGRTDTYTVKLDSQPSGTVTLGLASSDTSVATVDKSSLTFSRTTWSTTQTVTVSGVDDDTDSDRSTSITHTVSGADYAGVTAASVNVTLTDDDQKGVTVSKSSVTVTEAAGAGRTETYTVKLDSQPSGTVTVGVASGNTSVATVNKSSLTFTTTTWSTPQTVTVTGVDDEVDSNRSTTITHTVSGADYAGVTAASVSVTLTDDDQKGVTVSKTAVTVTEAAGAGRTDTYTVKLDSRPTGTVTVGVASGDTSVATVNTSSLTFSRTTWSTAQTVTVTGVDDDTDSDRSTTITHTVSGADYAGVTAASVSVTLTDDDEKGVTVSKTNLSLAESGGAGTYTVVLDSEPTGPVTVGVASGDTSVATVDKSSLTFTRTTWSTAQTVTVTGVGSGGTSTTVTHSVSGADYAGVTAASVSVTLVDVAIDLSVSDDDVSEGDGDTVVTVTADLQGTHTFPSALTLTITVEGSGTPTAVGFQPVSPFTLQIPPGQQSGSKAFTLRPVPNNVDNVDETITVSGAAGTLSVNPATILLRDDDDAPTGLRLFASPDSINEGDDATDVTVTAQLQGGTTLPADLILPLTLAGSAIRGPDYTLSGTETVTIPAANTSAETVLTITPAHDSIDEGISETIEIGTSAAGYESTDPAEVTLVDDDMAGLTFSKTTVTVTEAPGPGRTDTYTVVLQSEPTGTVTVGVASGDTSVATVDRSSLIFSRTTWSTPQTVTVTGVDDAVDSDRSTTITHTVSGADYADVTPATVGVTLIDDDTAGVRVDPEELQIAENGEGFYTLELTSEPLSPVVISISRLGNNVQNLDWDPKRLTFSAADWNRPQRVTVSVEEDPDALPGVAHMRHTASSLDPAYSGIGIDDVEILVGDDDQVVTSAVLTLNHEEIAEGEAPALVTVTATLDAVTTTDLSIALSLGGTATADDYTVAGTQTIQVKADQSTGQTVLTFAPVDDVLVEEAETIEISGTTQGIIITGAVLQLLDNDELVTSAVLTLSDEEIEEGETSALVTVTATLDAITSADLSIALSFGGTATTDDYSVGGFQAIEVEAGKQTGTTVLTFAPIDDALVEGDETIIVNGASPGLTVSPATLILLDDDVDPGEAVGALSVDIDRVLESARDTLVTVTLTLEEDFTFDEIRTFEVTVRGTGNDAAVDFAPVQPLTLTLLTNLSTASSTFILRPENDLVDESDETLTIAAVASPLPITSTTIILVDDDAPPAGISLSLDDPDIAEGDPATQITVTATVDGGTTFARLVNITLAFGGTAIEGREGDYTVSGPASITIPSGARSAAVALMFTPIDDSRDELDEIIEITGTTPTGLRVNPASLTVLDNDESLLALRADPQSVEEGGGPVTVTLTVTVRSGTPYDEPLTVALEFGGTAIRATDYTLAGAFTFTLPAGMVTASTTLTLTPIDDSLDEPDETLEIIGNAGIGYTSTAVVLVLDNDIPPARIHLTASPVTLLETDPPSRVLLEARVEGTTAFSTDTEITLELTGSAIPTVDYDVGGIADPFVIPAGRLTVTRELNITPIDDPHPEGAEQIVITGTTVVRVLPATITLLDDDGADLTISFSQAQYNANEYGAPATVIVSVTPAADRREVIELASSHLGGVTDEDYRGVPEEIVFEPGDEDFTFTVEALTDQVYESGERIRLTLSSLSTQVSFQPFAAATVLLVEQRSTQEFFRETRTVLALSARAWSDSVQTALEERFARTRQTEQWGGWQPDYQEPPPSNDPRRSPDTLPQSPEHSDRLIPGDWLSAWRQKNERRNMGLIEPRLSLRKVLARLRGWRPVLWAEGATHHFSGHAQALDYQGAFQAAHVGLDLHSAKRSLIGASLMRGRSTMDYSDGQGLDGSATATLYTIHPYLHFQAHDRVTLWTIGGLGYAPLSLQELDRDHDLSGSARMAAGGVRIQARNWEHRELAIRSDADIAWIGAKLPAESITLGGHAGRVRLLAELTQTFRVFGQDLIAAGEAGGRIDRGGAHRGAGAEAGGRISWRKPQRGLDFSVHGNSFLWHQSAFRIWGAGIQASWDPGAEKRGLVLRFASGRGPRGGKARLFDEAMDRLLQPADALDSELELGYGTGVRSRLLTLTFRLRGLSEWTAAVDLR